jgi:hypothetical protein
VSRPFLLFLDACIRGPLADGLLRRGWNVVRAVDLHGEGAEDPPLFQHAATLGRVFVTNDGPLLSLASQWLEAGRPFRMVYWSKRDDQRFTAGEILDAFDGLARERDPFAYPIYFLNPASPR